MASTAPQLLGLQKSFGYGDRLGLATPGHIAASQKYDFAPVFAQQSAREMKRTGRTPFDVMKAAADALETEGYDGAWGADADHLTADEDIASWAAAGFTFFTLDPSQFVNDQADDLAEGKVIGEAENLYVEGVFKTLDWDDRYLGEKYVAGQTMYRFNRESLYRAAIKYGRALAHCEKLAGFISSCLGHGAFEIEVSFDETASPTTPLEHLFVALELKQRGISVVSLAPHFVGELENGIDFRGDLAEFESSLEQHVAIARRFGPYKLSVHTGSDKFTIYPLLGRLCGNLLHVKTAGTSYLEALRILHRADFKSFRGLLEFCCERFPEDRRSYRISTTEDEVRSLATNAASDEDLLNRRPARQLLHVTYGSVLSEGKDSRGRPFRDTLMEVLEEHGKEYRQSLEAHFDRHLSALCKG